MQIVIAQDLAGVGQHNERNPGFEAVLGRKLQCRTRRAGHEDGLRRPLIGKLDVIHRALTRGTAQRFYAPASHLDRSCSRAAVEPSRCRCSHG